MCPACHKRVGPIRVFPSKAWREWVKTARVTCCGQPVLAFPSRPFLEDVPWRCAAVFYRDAKRGDLVGFQQGLADLLEKRGIISNDKWIVSWDGTRLDVDRQNPRVEIRLEIA